jgi:hypothetical protein
MHIGLYRQFYNWPITKNLLYMHLKYVLLFYLYPEDRVRAGTAILYNGTFTFLLKVNFNSSKLFLLFNFPYRLIENEGKVVVVHYLSSD